MTNSRHLFLQAKRTHLLPLRFRVQTQCATYCLAGRQKGKLENYHAICISNILFFLCRLLQSFQVEVDGTWKIFQDGWTLIVFATTGVYFDTDAPKTWRQRLYPLLYVVARTEHSRAVALGHEGLKIAASFLGIDDFLVHIIVSDHSAAIIKGGRMAWGEGVLVVTCWAHAARQAQEKLNKHSSFAAVVQEDMKFLHLSRSRQMFHNLWKPIKESWISLGEVDFAEAFEVDYIQEPYDSWFCAAAGVLSVTATTNALESENRTIKDRKILELQSPMGTLLWHVSVTLDVSTTL